MSAEHKTIEKAKLSAAERDALDDDDFCGPDRSFPVPDKEHVIAAKRLIGRAKKSAEVKRKIMACVDRKAAAMNKAEGDVQPLNEKLGQVWAKQADKVHDEEDRSDERFDKKLNDTIEQNNKIAAGDRQYAFMQNTNAQSEAVKNKANEKVRIGERQTVATPDTNRYARDAGYNLRQGSGFRQSAEAKVQYDKDQKYADELDPSVVHKADAPMSTQSENARNVVYDDEDDDEEYDEIEGDRRTGDGKARPVPTDLSKTGSQVASEVGDSELQAPLEEQGVKGAPKTDNKGRVKQRQGKKEVGQGQPVFQGGANEPEPPQNPNGPEPVMNELKELEAADRKLQGISERPSSTPLEDQPWPRQREGQIKNRKYGQTNRKYAVAGSRYQDAADRVIAARQNANPNLPSQMQAADQQRQEQQAQQIGAAVSQAMQPVVEQMQSIMAQLTDEGLAPAKNRLASEGVKIKGKPKANNLTRLGPKGQRAVDEVVRRKNEERDKEALRRLGVDEDRIAGKREFKLPLSPYEEKLERERAPLKALKDQAKKNPNDANKVSAPIVATEGPKEEYNDKYLDPSFKRKDELEPARKIPYDDPKAVQARERRAENERKKEEYKATPTKGIVSQGKKELRPPELKPGDEVIDPSEGQLSDREVRLHRRALKTIGGASPREITRVDKRTGKNVTRRVSGNPVLGSGVGMSRDVRRDIRRDAGEVVARVKHGDTKQSLKLDTVTGKNGHVYHFLTGSHINPEWYKPTEYDKDGKPITIDVEQPGKKKGIRLAPTNTDKGYYWSWSPEEKSYVTVYAPNYKGPKDSYIIPWEDVQARASEKYTRKNKIRTIPANRAGLYHLTRELDTTPYMKTPGERKQEKYDEKYPLTAERRARNEKMNAEHVAKGQALFKPKVEDNITPEARQTITDNLAVMNGEKKPGDSYVLYDNSAKGTASKVVGYFRDPEELYRFMGSGFAPHATDDNPNNTIKFSKRKWFRGKYTIGTAPEPEGWRAKDKDVGRAYEADRNPEPSAFERAKNVTPNKEVPEAEKTPPENVEEAVRSIDSVSRHYLRNNENFEADLKEIRNLITSDRPKEALFRIDGLIKRLLSAFAHPRRKAAAALGRLKDKIAPRTERGGERLLFGDDKRLAANAEMGERLNEKYSLEVKQQKLADRLDNLKGRLSAATNDEEKERLQADIDDTEERIKELLGDIKANKAAMRTARKQPRIMGASGKVDEEVTAQERAREAKERVKRSGYKKKVKDKLAKAMEAFGV